MVAALGPPLAFCPLRGWNLGQLRPLVVLLQRQGADQALDRGLAGMDANHVRAAFNLAVDPFQRAAKGTLSPNPLRGCC